MQFNTPTKGEKGMKDKTPRMEQESSRWRQHEQRRMGDMDTPKLDRQTKGESNHRRNSSQYAKVMKELRSLKQELSNLKKVMASILDEFELPAISSVSTNSTASIDHETYKSKQMIIVQENEDGPETKLAIVPWNLQTTLVETEHGKNTYTDKAGGTNKTLSVLESIKIELEATMMELASVQDEASQFTASTEIVRDELSRVTKETQFFKEEEEKANLTILDLSSSAAKAKEIKLEIEAAETERSSISEENAFIKEEICKAANDIKLGEERLQAAMEELERIKASEAVAVRNLKGLIESGKRKRDLGDYSVSMSKFEYEYMKGNAGGIVVEIAEKKVGAMKAWVEALNASEKEMAMKAEELRRESREMRT